MKQVLLSGAGFFLFPYLMKLYFQTANDLWFEGDSPEDEAIPQSPRPDDLD